MAHEARAYDADANDAAPDALPPEPPPAPASVLDASGRPHFGAWSGELPEVRWDGLAPPLSRGAVWNALHAKRWHFVSLGGPECLFAMAIIDVGWATSAFAYLFDRRTRSLRADLSYMGLPGVSAKVSRTAGAGARSVFRGPGVTLELGRPVGGKHWEVRVHAGRALELEAVLDASDAPPTLCAVAAIEGGAANCTHKTHGLRARGVARAGGERFSLDGTTASFDHTSGLLARDTRWKWASASSPELSLNLVEGFNGPVENALWVRGRLVPVGAAEIKFQPGSPLGRWTVRTDDGRVDLEFTPEGARREDTNVGLAVSKYIQPIGTFRGTVRAGGVIPVDGLLGVTEDHVARW